MIFPKLPPRLARVFANNPLYFVTFCTYRRRKILLTPGVHASFRTFAIRAYCDLDIAVGRYVIMADHVHLFVCGPDDFALGRWVGTLKQFLARRAVSMRPADPMWQRGFFDHTLRNDESYNNKWDYVRMNPARAGLTSDAENWPYSGEIVILDRS